MINEEIERRWNKALPKVFRCTECGKYRLIEDFDKMKELDAAFFTCQDNPDSVSHFQRKKIIFYLFLYFRNTIPATKKNKKFTQNS